MSEQAICSFCDQPYTPPALERVRRAKQLAAGEPGETQICRDCFYGGEHHTARLAPFLAELREHCAHTYVEHTGGGCFWIAARLEDGRVVAFTDAFRNEGAWQTDAALPEAPEGPWYGVLYKTDAGEEIATGVPLNMAEAAAFLAAALPPEHAEVDEGGEGGSA